MTAILEARGFVNSGSSKKDFVKDYLAGMETPWMLIFDNYDNPGAFGDIKSYFPSGTSRTSLFSHACRHCSLHAPMSDPILQWSLAYKPGRLGNGSIIITSRHAESKRLGCPISVDSLSEDEAVELLLRKSESEDTEAHRSEARKIVKKLACLALAVDQAAAYISLRHLPITQFVQRYEQSKEALMKFVPNSPLWEYRRCLDDAERESSLSVFTTWEMSFRQIAEIDKEQDAIGHFLTLSSYFNPAKISEFIFAECSADRFLNGSIPDWLKIFYRKEVWDEDSFQEVISGLANLSLIQHYEIETRHQYQSSWFTLHLLVRDWLQLRLSTKEQQKYSWEALEVLSATGATSLECLRFYLIMDELLLHLQSLFKYSEVDGLPDVDILETHLPLLSDLAWFASGPDRPFAFAKALWLKIIHTSVQYFGERSAMTFRSKLNLAMLYAFSYLYDQAIKILQDVLSAMEIRSLNRDLIAGALCVLAKCYQGQKDFTKAEDVYLRALTIASKCRSIILYGLANLYKDRGNYTKAVNFFEKSVQCLERPQVMIQLAETYHKVGKFEEAEAMYLRAVGTYTNASHISLRLFGVLCSDLGKLYADTGRFTQAEKCQMEGLKAVKKWCNPAKPEQALLISVQTFRVGRACHKAGHLLEARSYYLQAKSDFEQLRDLQSAEWTHEESLFLAAVDAMLSILDEPTSPSNKA